MITFGRSHSGSSASGGSGSVTSRAAPAISPATNASRRATSSTSGPRATLINQACRGSAASVRALMRRRVSSVAGAARTTWSTRPQTSSILLAGSVVDAPSTGRPDLLTAITWAPQAFNRGISDRAMPPAPMIPTVEPCSDRTAGSMAFSSQCRRTATLIWRRPASKSARACSATFSA